MRKTSSLKKDLVEELHKGARKTFKRRRVILKGIRDLFQADLVEMIPYANVNKGYKYILIVINAFSKYIWAFPIKRKTGKDVTDAIAQIFTQRKNVPKHLQTDNGKEFYNKIFRALMQRYNINHYSTYSTLKSSIVERSNRTLKNRMWKEFSMQGNYKWLHILPKIVADYNNTTHSTTGFKPINVNQKNAKEILNTVYNYIKVLDPTPRKFRLGDPVRISKYREAFSKSYTPNWSNEIFTIAQVQNTYPRTYLLEDAANQAIYGGFYEHELQHVKHPDVYLVEKVIRRKGNQVLVKWLGLDSRYNSWISKHNIL